MSAHAVPDRIVRERERATLTGVSRTAWYCGEREGRYPRRLRIGSNSVGWRLSDLISWQQASGIASPISPVELTPQAAALREAVASVNGCSKRLHPHVDFRGADVRTLQRPLVYAWIRDKRVLYVGRSHVGLARPLSLSHEVMRSITDDDRLRVWPCDDSAAADRLEAQLIGLLKPEFNRMGRGPGRSVELEQVS